MEPNTISNDVRPAVDTLLAEAVSCGASDIHVEPMAGGYEARFRVDGLLRVMQKYSTENGRSVVARLMVMGGLLTYRQDVPQEGRIEWSARGGEETLMLRLSVMPTTHGLRAAVRLPAELIGPQSLDSLDLPERALATLKRFASADSGMLLVTGPAGSGKTTTIYALLDHIAATNPGISIVSLEDPVERDLPGVTQIQVSPFGQLTYERAMKSILRQDPQVLMLGEIRDAATASLAIQAALSGHRLISTLHAGSPAGAVWRLLEMGVEPYQVVASLYGALSIRLLRRKMASGYKGRVPIAEIGLMDDQVRAAILQRDSGRLAKAFAGQPGYVPLREAAAALVRAGLTDLEEVERTLGPGGPEQPGAIPL